MKKIFYSLSVALLVTSIMTIGCDSPAQNVADAKGDLATAQDNLKKAQDDSVAVHKATVAAYKKQIAENEELLANYKVKIANQNKTIRDEYEAAIDKLETKNEDMETMIDRNEVTALDTWDIFKMSFSQTRDELGIEMIEFNNKMILLSKSK